MIITDSHNPKKPQLAEYQQQRAINSASTSTTSTTTTEEKPTVPLPTLCVISTGRTMSSASATTAASAANAAAMTTAATAAASASSSSCKKKLNAPQHPSALRQLLPIAACLLSFATVLSILIVYMDTTAIRHQQFRLNMSRDYELYGVRQDEPTLLTYIREIHLKKYPFPFMKDAPAQHTNFSSRADAAQVAMGHLLAGLVGNKPNGVFVQSLPQSGSGGISGSSGNNGIATAAWLAETLGWGGMIVEPDVRLYFGLRQENAHRDNVQVVHSCLSQTGFPKEVTLHEHTDVRINSLLDEESASFNSRVKCFPLYTLMLAVNHTEVDVLTMGCHGDELQILETVPFNRVLIRVIAIHIVDYFRHDSSMAEAYAQNVTRFLQSKSYRLVKMIDHSYVYQLSGRALAAAARRI